MSNWVPHCHLQPNQRKPRVQHVFQYLKLAAVTTFELGSAGAQIRAKRQPRQTHWRSCFLPTIQTNVRLHWISCSWPSLNSRRCTCNQVSRARSSCHAHWRQGSSVGLPRNRNRNRKAEVLVDGRIRRGTDVLKAIALGARAVLLGHPILWGLAVGGESGVERVLQLIRNELELGLRLSGCVTVDAIDRSLVVPSRPLGGL